MSIKISDSLEDLIKEAKPTIKIKPSVVPVIEEKKPNIPEQKPSPKKEIKKEVVVKKIEEKLPESNESILYPTHQCPSPLNIITITKKAYTDIMLMAHAVNKISEDWDSKALYEVYCYLTVNQSDYDIKKPYTITDIYIPQQTAEIGGVHVNEQGVLEASRFIRENNLAVVGWSHSHGMYEVYSSPTDDANHKVILSETFNYFEVLKDFNVKYIYEITVNERENKYGVVLSQFPCGYISQKNDSEITIIGNDYTPEELEAKKNAIFQTVKSRVQISKGLSDQLSPEDIRKQLAEEIVANFIQKFQKMEAIFFERLNEEDNKNFDYLRKKIGEYHEIVAKGAEESASETVEKLFEILKNLKDKI